MNCSEVYSADNCPWCDCVKAFLHARGIDLEEIGITADAARTPEMTERSIQRTVPRIFVDDVNNGGFDELSMLNLSDTLD